MFGISKGFRFFFLDYDIGILDLVKFWGLVGVCDGKFVMDGVICRGDCYKEFIM